MRAVIASGAFVVCMTLTACSHQTEVQPVELGSCGVEGPGHPERCGVFQVPFDWADPRAPQMEIHVLVVPAVSTDPEPDPLFYLAGFGDSAFVDPSWAYHTFTDLRMKRDLVFVEQRGTGTMAEYCPLPQPGTDEQTVQSAVADCLSSLQRDPRHDTTASAVRDLDRARIALGYDTINIYGGSYGVSMGLAYLQEKSEHVRSAVFDSGSLLDTRLWELIPTNAQLVLDSTMRDCEADVRCSADFDPAADLATVLEHLEKAPVEIDLGDGQTLVIDPIVFLNGLIDLYLATPEGRAVFPAHMDRLADDGWEDVVRSLAELPTSGASEISGTQVQTITLRCSDEWARMDPAAIAAQTGSIFTDMKAAEAVWQETICEVWPHDDGVSGTAETNVPVLFVNGAYDPADPPTNVAAATRTMPNALVVAIPGAGHGAIGEPCVLTQVTTFIQAGEPSDPADWSECLRELDQRPFRFSGDRP